MIFICKKHFYQNMKCFGNFLLFTVLFTQFLCAERQKEIDIKGLKLGSIDGYSDSSKKNYFHFGIPHPDSTLAVNGRFGSIAKVVHYPPNENTEALKPLSSGLPANPLCSPWDSCAGRCGEAPRGLPFICSCDAMCPFFKDCCIDFDRQCKISYNTDLLNFLKSLKPPPRCSGRYPFSWPSYIISDCPTAYEDKSVRRQCENDVHHLCKNEQQGNGGSPLRCSEEVRVNCKSMMLKKCQDEQRATTETENTTNITISLCEEKNYSSEEREKCEKSLMEVCSNNTAKFCGSTAKGNRPVISINGLIYTSHACAVCNGETMFQYLDPYSVSSGLQVSDERIWKNHRPWSPLRFCFPAIEKCIESDIYIRNESLVSLCSKYNGPVIVRSGDDDQEIELLYKNIYCAMCNGVDLRTASCPSWIMTPNKASPLLTMYHSLSENVVADYGSVAVHSPQNGGLPAPFSILLNFGLDGREKMMFSSEGEEEMRKNQKLCGSGHIWDPFNKVCRKLYCSTEFTLVDFRCVKKEKNDPGFEGKEGGQGTFEENYIHLALGFEVEYFDLLEFYENETKNITNVMREALASSLKINADRFKNVKVNIDLGDFQYLNLSLEFFQESNQSHPVRFTVEFDLYETHDERTVENIVSSLASSVSGNGFDMIIENMNGRVFELQQITENFRSWCSPETGGKQQEYWNSDFTLLLNEDNSSASDSWIKGLLVNKTQKVYEKGQFVANILFQGYEFHDSSINVSSVVFVCEKANENNESNGNKLNDSCARIMLTEAEYKILPNGTLEISDFPKENDVMHTTMYEMAENKSVFVCFTPKLSPKYRLLCALEFDPAEAYVSLILLCGSVLALTVVLFTYTLFPQLRNLPGCNTMNLTFSLLSMQVTFLFGERDVVTGNGCRVAAVLLHYEILCSFMWMNVIAYDMYKTFASNTGLNNIRSKRSFLPRYLLYAYGCPILIILTCTLLDIYGENISVSPHYGWENVCWITNRKAAFLFFATPLGLIIIVNLFLYVLTILSIRKVKHILWLNTMKKARSDVLLYARIAFVIGLTWTFMFIAAYTPSDRTILNHVLTYFFIICNTLQGVYLFIAFVCNHTVAVLYSDFLKKKLGGKQKQLSENSNFSVKICKEMSRSVSTDTSVSTVSVSNDNFKFEAGRNG